MFLQNVKAYSIFHKFIVRQIHEQEKCVRNIYIILFKCKMIVPELNIVF